jgi:hypothetical protein
MKEWTTFHEWLSPGELRSTERMLDIRNPLDGPTFDSLQDATQWCPSMRAGDRQDSSQSPQQVLFMKDNSHN